MSFLKNNEVKLVILIHGWGSIILGLLLIFTCGTGTVAVFSRQISEWTAGANELPSHITPSLDAAVRRIAASAPPEQRLSMTIGKTHAGGVMVTDVGLVNGKLRQATYELNPDRSINRIVINPKPPMPGDAWYNNNRTFLRQWLVNLHSRYGTRGWSYWGIYLVALVGVTMASAMISGLVIQWRKLIPDLFTFRKNAQPKVSKKDAHTIIGAWLLPFGFIWAFTGAEFGFYTGAQFTMVANAPKRTPPFARMAQFLPPPGPFVSPNLDAVIADATKRSGGEPMEVNVLTRPGGPARIHVLTGDYGKRWGVQDGYLDYSAADGHFLTQMGGAPTSFRDLTLAWLMPIHFGYFAGLFSRIAVAAIGFAMANLTISGIRLWVVSREDKEPVWILLDRATTILSYGQMIGFAGAAAGFFLSLPNDPNTWTVGGFWAGLLLALAASFVVPRKALAGVLRCCAALVVVALPYLRWRSGGPGWGLALATGRHMIVVVDLAMFAIAIALVAKPLSVVLSQSGLFGPKTLQPKLEPAE